MRVTLLSLLLAQATVQSKKRVYKHEELRIPNEIRSVDGVLNTTISIEIFEMDSENLYFGKMVTRALNGQIPGPTLRVKPGDKVYIKFKNLLTDQPTAIHKMNDFQSPDTSNLHWHGGYLWGKLPSDDVTNSVKPQGEYQYITHFPENHMPGTHWVHTHSHGSSAIQVGGGCAMALIVDEPEGYLPPYIANAKELTMVINDFNLEVLEAIRIASGDDNTDYRGGGGFLAVNGQWRPTITVQSGRWHRWRIVFAGFLAGALDLQLLREEGLYEGSGCEMILLAKDGIYIKDYPRWVGVLPIPPGGRADVMMRCHLPAFAEPDYHIVNSFRGEIARIKVIPADREYEFVAPAPWTPPRPNYLWDLITTPSSTNCSCKTVMAGLPYYDQINGRQYDPNFFLHTSYVGAVVERTLTGSHIHPYHQHVYPYQMISGTGNTEYFRDGDWHDTYLNPLGDAHPVIRYQPKRWAGTNIVLHCHRLMHEDMGMMSAERVRTTEEPQMCTCGTDLTEYPDEDLELGASESVVTRNGKRNDFVSLGQQMKDQFYDRVNDDGNLKPAIIIPSIVGSIFIVVAALMLLNSKGQRYDSVNENSDSDDSELRPLVN